MSKKRQVDNGIGRIVRNASIAAVVKYVVTEMLEAFRG